MFDALEVSLALVRSLGEPLSVIRCRDPQLFDQIRRAATSLVLNLAEGRKRIGRDRLNHWRIASGSADEVRAALIVTAAWGDLDPVSYERSFQLLDRIAAMLWRLTH